MQIKEDDFLWRMYKRYYKGHTVPHPKTICNYFWKSVGGMISYVFYDLNVFIITPILLLMLWGSLEGFYLCEHLNASGGVFFFLLTAFLSIFTVGRLFASFATWAEENKKTWLTATVLVGGMFLVLSAGVGTLYKGDRSFLWCWLYGGLTIIGVLSLIAGFFVLRYWLYEDTNTGKVTKAYLTAVKNRVCPLVKIPGEGDVKPDSEQPKDSV